MKWQRDNFLIYGAIEPMTGKHFQQEYPKRSYEYFQQFLDWLSVQLGSDYAILQIDQAIAHTSSAIGWSENIIPLLQPPHSQATFWGGFLLLNYSGAKKPWEDSPPSLAPERGSD